MAKGKSIEKQIEENKKNVDEFVKQLRLAGVKEKTIKNVMKDIQDYQEKLWAEQMSKAFDNMRKIIRGEEDDI